MSSETDTGLVGKVARTIERHHLLEGQKTLVALSGGADSVALLRILLALGYDCVAAHCNFQLRGDESQRDERFVRQLCQHLGVPLHIKTHDTRAYAREHGVSIEMAARDLRYAYFDALSRQLGLQSVCVAHHRGDNAETILLNMVRGTGIKGLTGMPYKRGLIVRPLLDASRDEITGYLKDEGQDYVTDSSNQVADVKRNMVRLQVMPLLRQLNPSVEETLTSNARHLGEVYDLLRESLPPRWSTRADGAMTLAKKDIGSHLALFEALSPMGFNAAQTDEIWAHMDGQAGALWQSKTHTLLRDREHLVACRRDETSPAIGTTRVEMRLADASEWPTLPRTPHVACLDADTTGTELRVRPIKEGDRFVPLGMRGSRLVSDYLTDRKVDLLSRQRQEVLVRGDDIVWLIGHRIDDRYKVVEGKTRRILVCTTAP